MEHTSDMQPNCHTLCQMFNVTYGEDIGTLEGRGDGRMEEIA